MTTLHERIAQARDALVAAGIGRDEAALDAALLARHALGWDHVRLVVARLQNVPDGFEDQYAPLVARRARREPASQILGTREFWGLELEVTRDVLTPRPETELIVEEAIAQYPDRSVTSIADVGTGSGCLAIALALEFPRARIVATDISAAALDVARRNAKRHTVDGRIAFILTEYLPPAQPLDLIVSNPPYIAERDADLLSPEVRDHEPHEALFGGQDGLDVYRDLLAERGEVAKGGRLILELGYDQLEPVSAQAISQGWAIVSTRRDLQGIPRVLTLAPSRRS